MLYKGFYVKMTPATLTRTDKDGREVQCEGFTVEVFDSDAEKVEIDTFSIAVGYEILANDIHEAEQLVKDYIECEEKEYCRMMDEYYSNE